MLQASVTSRSACDAHDLTGVLAVACPHGVLQRVLLPGPRAGELDHQLRGVGQAVHRRRHHALCLLRPAGESPVPAAPAPTRAD